MEYITSFSCAGLNISNMTLQLFVDKHHTSVNKKVELSLMLFIYKRFEYQLLNNGEKVSIINCALRLSKTFWNFIGINSLF